ncbi:hypothetical protein PV10_09115 [Exophiala mesophila]|uniref:SWI-SNF chromatin-remodeling complex protein n=1 Tax=Exophiala mesophila TaxID=212818 RepID=A0A0D1Z024_EXOME|nr:uncharacterized protein PV10_09115 [Exophiala mesophila]KIV88197.1 hypothetical protein PV10_09115 [Exophiala mesophila]
MAAPSSYSNYKTNVGRSVTKKWKEANQISYDGDDWGDDDDEDYGHQPHPPPVPASAGPTRPSQPVWERQPARSFTSPVQPPPPAPSQSYARPSFDRGDDRRQFPSSAGFDSAYPTSQRPPFPDLTHDDTGSHSSLRDQSSLRSNTPSQSPSPSFRPGSRGSSRGRQYSPYNDAAYAAPGGYPQPPFSPQQRRSGSSGRPALADLYQRHDSPARPDSRSSNMSARHFPPRKASLSQQPQPSDLPHSSADHIPSGPVAPSPSTEDKPIPAFIRPSDIYKQIPEALEKVRKSQDSSRPSLDSLPAPLPDSRQLPRGSFDPKDLPSPGPQSTDDSDSMRRLKPSLDTVVERKSEYGMENLLGSPTTTSIAPPEVKTSDTNKDTQADGVSRHPTNASSVYTDRPDPVSASTVSRSSSVDLKPEPQSLAPDRSSYAFGLPPLGRLSTFGVDLGSFGVTPSTSSDPIPTPASTQLPAPGTRDEGSDQASTGRPLQHQSSLGYKTLVRTAFEQSQTDALSSPSSSGDCDRSNSASTTDISPIIGHKGSSLGITGPDPGPGIPAILEEEESSSSRPTSTATLKAAQPPSSRRDDDEEQSFDSMRSGYRRPFSPMGTDDAPTQQSGSSTTTPAQNPPPTEKSLPPVPQSTTAISPEQPSTERTTSEEWEDWQAQRHKFKAQAGLNDTETNTSVASSPNSQPETQPIGSKATHLEETDANSGRSTPTSSAVLPSSSAMDPDRPLAQTRAESFRPAIPGGWQSFTNTPGTASPDLAATELGAVDSKDLNPAADNTEAKNAQAPPATHPLARPALNANDTQQSTESIPTARPPPSSSLGPDNPTQKAFAAAASAGNALAGSLSGQQIAHRGSGTPNRSPTRSEISSENEWDASSVSSGEPAGTIPKTKLVSPPSATTSMPSSNAMSGGTGISSPTLEDIPAPLRTSRLSESLPTTRPPIPDVTIPPDSENDKLQQDIVESLTANSFVPDSKTGDPTSLAIESTETGTHVINDHVQTEAVSSPVTGQLIGSQSTTGREPGVVAGDRPSLPKRFSWETESEPSTTALTPKPTNVPTTGSPSTPKATLGLSSDLPSLQTGPGHVEGVSHPRQLQHPIGPQSPPPVRSPTTAITGQAPESGTTSPSPFAQATGLRQASQTAKEESISQLQGRPGMVVQQSEMSSMEPREPQETRNNSMPLDPTPLKSQTAVESASFRSIMNLGTAQERILAFNESRRQQSVSDGQLEEWLQSLNTAEYSELFASNGRLANDAVESGVGYKASPRRMLSDSVGSRHIQEDGKKLIAKAGRFGGKAGSAAKGLFARGKEKMRTASSGEKGRRKSPSISSVNSNEALPEGRSQIRAVMSDGPPQIPFTLSPASPLAVEPSDWFSNSLADTKPLSTSNSEDARPSNVDTVASSDPTLRQASEPMASLATRHQAHSTSSAVSALDDETEDAAVVPSRSISQVTRPLADDSHTSSLPASTIGDNPSPGQASSSRSYHDDPAHNLVVMPRTQSRAQIAGDSFTEASPEPTSLQIRDERRRSMLSDVSSASPVPARETDTNISRRSVSPHDEGFRASPPPFEEEDSAAVARTSDDQPPGYPGLASGLTDLPPEKAAIADTSMEEGAISASEIVPAEQRPQPGRAPSPRYSNDMSADAAAFHLSDPSPDIITSDDPNPEMPDLRKASTQPISPISQTLSKGISQVSVEEVNDVNNGMSPRQSRSYSRPFSADPNVRNHPAFKDAEPEQPPMDRAQMYSTESAFAAEQSPLPSARRPLEDLQHQKPQPSADATRESRQIDPSYLSHPLDQPPVPEGTYRIPGPYIQNYRSPKQITTPRTGRSETQIAASGQPLPSALRAQQLQQYQETMEQQQYQQRQSQSYGQDFPRPPKEEFQRFPQHQPYPQIQQPWQTQTLQPQQQASYDGERHEKAPQATRRSEAYGLPPSVPSNQGQTSVDASTGQHFAGLAQSQRQSMGPPPLPGIQTPVEDLQAGRKKSAFGGLFGTGAKSRNKLQKGASESTTNTPSSQPKEKRTSLFRRNSRPNSISSQRSSLYGGQEQFGQRPPSMHVASQTTSNQPPTGHAVSHNTFQQPQRPQAQSQAWIHQPPHQHQIPQPPPEQAQQQQRQSQTWMQPQPQQSAIKPNETKKKRFSGLGGLFRSSHKAAPAASAPPQSTPGRTAQPFNQQSPVSNALSPQAYMSQMHRDQPDRSGAFMNQRPEQPGQGMAAASQWYPSEQGRMHPSTSQPNHTERSYSQNYPPPHISASHDQGASFPANNFARTDSMGGVVNAYSAGTSPQGDISSPLGGPHGLPRSSGPSASQTPHEQTRVSSPNVEQRRPADLRIDTVSPIRGGRSGFPATAPTQIYPQYPARDSYSHVPSTAGGQMPHQDLKAMTNPRTQSSNTKDQRSHVIDLHKRSRSPKLGRRSSEDLPTRPDLLQEDRGLASNSLGTFSNKRLSPVGGVVRSEDDQERPFAIGLPPGMLEDEQQDGRERQGGRGQGIGRSDTPVSAHSKEAYEGTGTVGRATREGLSHGLVSRSGTAAGVGQNGRDRARSMNKDEAAIELPGSKPDGYESEEEVVMSATAYPGQEWMPVFVGDGKWDD